MKKLLPIILALIGLGVGAGAGIALKPDPVMEAHGDDSECVCAEPVEVDTHETVALETLDSHGNPVSAFEYVKLNNQFIVPVVEHGKVVALVVMSLSVEVSTGGKEVVYQREPRLQDAFLRVLFAHANTGGFDGNFTSDTKMSDLRGELLEAVTEIIGEYALNVLVTELVRQDL